MLAASDVSQLELLPFKSTNQGEQDVNSYNLLAVESGTTVASGWHIVKIELERAPDQLCFRMTGSEVRIGLVAFKKSPQDSSSDQIEI